MRTRSPRLYLPTFLPIFVSRMMANARGHVHTKMDVCTNIYWGISNASKRGQTETNGLDELQLSSCAPCQWSIASWRLTKLATVKMAIRAMPCALRK